MRTRLGRLLCLMGICTVLCACGAGEQHGATELVLDANGNFVDPATLSDSSQDASSAATIAPKGAEDYYLEASTILGWQFVNETAARKAIDSLDQAIEADSGYANAYLARGSAYLCLADGADNWNQSIADFQKYQQMNPQDAAGYLGEAEVLIRKNDIAGATELLNTALELVDAPSSQDDAANGASSDQGISSSENASDGVSTFTVPADSSASVSSNVDGSDSSADKTDQGTGGNTSGGEECSNDNKQMGSETPVDTDNKDNAGIYTSGIKEIFSVDRAAIQARIDEISGESFCDSRGRMRLQTLKTEDGTVSERIFYAAYQGTDDQAAVIRTYSPDGNLIGTAFHLYRDTQDYVYGFVSGSDTWNVCLPLWDESGSMTGIASYYGGELIGYDIYLHNSEGTMVGTEYYSADKNLIDTVYLSGYSENSAVDAGRGVVTEPKYSLEEVYTMVKLYL